VLEELMEIGSKNVFKYSVQKFTRTLSHTRPPLWSSGQSSWLQIQSYRFQFPALAVLLRSSMSGMGLLSLMSAIEELFGRKTSGSGLKILEYGRGDPLC
jgi:hypothetical protein